jgi:S-adenosylmethionine/arginine decarboxylase-like enzyme
MKELKHLHLMVRAEITKPIKTEEYAKLWLQELVELIDMKIAAGPVSKYVDMPGNEGVTAAVSVETSHIAFHIWEKKDPMILQFDLYTCGELDHKMVIGYLWETFGITNIQWQYLNRENGFELIDSNLDQ